MNASNKSAKPTVANPKVEATKPAAPVVHVSEAAIKAGKAAVVHGAKGANLTMALAAALSSDLGAYTATMVPKPTWNAYAKALKSAVLGEKPAEGTKAASDFAARDAVYRQLIGRARERSGLTFEALTKPKAEKPAKPDSVLGDDSDEIVGEAIRSNDPDILSIVRMLSGDADLKAVVLFAVAHREEVAKVMERFHAAKKPGRKAA